MDSCATCMPSRRHIKPQDCIVMEHKLIVAKAMQHLQRVHYLPVGLGGLLLANDTVEVGLQS